MSRLVTGPPSPKWDISCCCCRSRPVAVGVAPQHHFPTRTFLGYRCGESAAHQPWRTRLRRWRDLFDAAAVLGCRVMARLAGGTEASLRRREPLESVPATAAISAADLSEQVPLSLIGNRVTFRVASDSMTPTLQAGDELTIGPATGLRIGDLVLYESEEGLVCHRLRATNEAGELVMSGDAAPSATEAVDGARVKGLVSAVIPRRASQQYLRHLVRQAGRRLLLGPLGRIGVALLMPWLTVTICARTSIRSMALWHPIDRARGLSRRTLETRLAKTAADQRPLSLRVSFGSTMLGSLECASGRIEVGAVGRRFGLDRLFHEIADRPS
ncbi:MAG: S24/S26 family peptidase [Nitrospiraceae bacterium]